jgi:peptidyl-prolyl cis-trans isomerase A (cyclophilin A)
MKTLLPLTMLAALLVASACTPQQSDDAPADEQAAESEEQAAENSEGEGEARGSAASDESPAAADDESEAQGDEEAAIEPQVADRNQTTEGAADEPGAESAEDILAQFSGEGQLQATIRTNRGELHCELFEERAPKTVANFAGLATGKKTFRDHETGELVRANFYNGLIFHRVIPNFMIQGGDPTGTGRGGPGYQFEDEFDDSLRHDKAGILSMANSGPNTNGSQFFITDAPTPHLNDRHSVFGVCDETDVVSQIANAQTRARNKPAEDIVIESLTVSRVEEDSEAE